MTASASRSQPTQASPSVDRAEPFPATPPPGFLRFEQYNWLQLAFMKAVRLVLRRRQFCGWPPDEA
jgi:hypothetical protein